MRTVRLLRRSGYPGIFVAPGQRTLGGREGLVRGAVEVEALERFDPRIDDVYVASFPKSGSTLLQMMLYQLVTDGSMAFGHIHAVAPSLDEAVMRGEDEYLRRLDSPRLLKTHWRREILARCLSSGRWIYLIRHPGDVLISAYHHWMMQTGRSLSLDAYSQTAFLSLPPYGSWIEHTSSWWPHRNDVNVLFLRYEDVTADLGRTITRVADFCGVHLSRSTRRRAERRCSLAYMKRHSAKFDPRLRTTLYDAPTFIRKGASGGWASLPAETQIRLQSELTAIAESFGGDHRDAFHHTFCDTHPTGEAGVDRVTAPSSQSVRTAEG